MVIPALIHYGTTNFLVRLVYFLALLKKLPLASLDGLKKRQNFGW
jgi:hypothetical protein